MPTSLFGIVYSLRLFCYSLFAISTILFSNCTHHYYTTTQENSLVLTEQKDFKIAGEVAPLLDRSIGGSVNVGYSPFRFIGLQSSAIYRFTTVENRDFDSFSGNSQGYLWSGALGTYFPIGKKQNFFFDVYGGFGRGSVHNKYSDFANSKFTFNKSYMQGGFYLQDSLISFRAAIKIATLDYTNGIVKGRTPSSDGRSINLIEETDIYVINEAVLQAYYRIKKGQLYFTFAFMGARNNNIFRTQFRDQFRFSGATPNFMNISSTIGVIFDLNHF